MGNSSSIWVIIGIIGGAIGALFLIVKLLTGAANIHPLICWKISPLYDPGQCLVETSQLN